MIKDLEKRRAYNADIIRRLKKGEALVDNPQATWFPDRPKIQKDPQLIAKLYCQDGHSWLDGECRNCGTRQKTTLSVVF